MRQPSVGFAFTSGLSNSGATAHSPVPDSTSFLTMKTKTACTAALIVGLSIFHLTRALAQGPLAPPAGPPAPTMKSLQEIWDKIDALETRATALETQNAMIGAQNTLLLQGLSAVVPTSRLAWLISTVDSSSGAIYSSMAFGPDGQPAIAYYDYGGNNDLKFARFDGAQWTLSVVDSEGDVGANPSLAFGPDGHPAIFYTVISGSSYSLKFARFDGNAWTVTAIVDPDPQAFSSSLAFGPDGQPAIAYEAGSGLVVHLKFARFNGSDWTAPVVVDPADNYPFRASLAFAPDGQPAIAYQVGPYPDFFVKFAHFSGGAWTTALVDNGGSESVGVSIKLAFGPDGEPAIAYKSFPGDSEPNYLFDRLKYAHRVGTIWSVSFPKDDFQGETRVGFEIDLAFGVDGQPAISYKTGIFSDKLALLRYSGTAWILTTVDPIPDVGEYSSMVFGPDGQPAIAYTTNTYSGSNPKLKFARKGLFKPTP